MGPCSVDEAEIVTPYRVIACRDGSRLGLDPASGRVTLLKPPDPKPPRSAGPPRTSRRPAYD